MGKTSYSIYMDYQRAIRQAERLERAASDIKRERSSLIDCQSNIASAWKGESATAYLNKVKKISGDLEKVSKNLKDTAKTIRRIAQNTYEAEKKAIELAKERRY